MTDKPLNPAFPLLYAHWYAASLFLEAGYPAAEVLARLGIDAASWKACRERYGQLHFADTGWVASAYARAGLAAPAQDRALWAHLTGDRPVPAGEAPFSLRQALAQLRRAVEDNPRLGPFAEVPWVARYLGERRFPVIRYVDNGNQVCVDGHPICDRKGVPLAGVDPRTFRPLGDRWFRDAHRVYGQGETPTKLFWFVARGADPDSFVVLNERYGADRAAGYYITGLRLPTAEPGTFGIISYYYGRGQKPGIHTQESHYAKDSRKVYAYGVAIEGAHAPSFEAIGDEGHYFADQHRIYWERTPLEEADRETFTCASAAGQYRAYDRHRPYYAGRPQSVSAEFEHWRDYFAQRPAITDSWWHREQARREASIANTTEPVALGGPFFSDGARVVVRPLWPRDGDWVSLDYLDHDSFRPLVGMFGHDRYGLRYLIPGQERYGREPVKGADPEHFQALSTGWFRDSRQVYYFDHDAPMPELAVVKADLATFTVLGGAYARDAKGLIVEGVRKRGIDDPGAVVALGYLFARLGNTLLYRGKPVSKPGKLDPATARAVHDQLLIDASGHLLFGGSYRKPLAGLEPASLRFLNRVFAVDAGAVYALGDSGLVRCEGLAPGDIEPMGQYAVRVGDTRLHLSGGQFHKTALAADDSADAHANQRA